MNDSVANAWQEMIADDDEKHAFMKRLLLEVAYTGNFDSAEYKAYMQKNQNTTGYALHTARTGGFRWD